MLAWILIIGQVKRTVSESRVDLICTDQPTNIYSGLGVDFHKTIKQKQQNYLSL